LKAAPAVSQKPWMKRTGKLKDLHEETEQINIAIEKAFEQIDPQMLGSETGD
jgi:hypothetical protein